MAKRNKAKFASKTRKSALRVEALEQRQLLATVSGSGVEVASNVINNGNTFDQVVLTGASVTVTPDAGQIVRVSFLDPSGDIVQAEFSGDGKFTVSLEDLKLIGGAGYNNANPAQTYATAVTGNDGKVHAAGSPIDYAQGLASIFIDNPEFNTNVSVFSAGLLTNFGFFNGQAKQGGNHYADIARIVIVGDPTNEAAYNNFGGIRAANAIFSASSGVVGIRAENIAVQTVVIIGDIDASGSGVPTLTFHPLSQFEEVRVAGGDLVQTNGSGALTSGSTTGGLGAFNRIVSTDGARSDFNPTLTKQQNIDSGAYLLKAGISQETLALTPLNTFVQMDGNWTANLAAGTMTQVLGAETNVYKFTGTGQALFDKMFDERRFSGNLTIVGDIDPNLEVNVARVDGVLDVVGNVAGRIEANGLGANIGTLKIEGNLTGEVFVVGVDRSLGFRDAIQNKIGSVIITGNMGSTSASGAYIIAESMGDVTVAGDFTGTISTDVNGNGVFNGTALQGTNYIDYEGAIGNVSIAGNIINGSVVGITGIGNVNVGGNITGAGPYSAGIGGGVFVTSAAQNGIAIGTSAANLSIGKIGTVTVVGDVDLNSPASLFIDIMEEGNFGNVSIQGNGLLGRFDNNDFLNVGITQVGVGFGNQNNTTGTFTISDAKSVDPRGTDIDFGGVVVGTAGVATGKVGLITINGGKEDTDVIISGIIGAANLGTDIVEVTGVNVNGGEDIFQNGNVQGSKIGPLNYTPIAGVGTTDANDGKGTGVATSVTIAGNILLDDGIANKGETFAGLTINPGKTNSAVTVNGVIRTNDYLKGTGSSIGPIALTANSVTFNATVVAETVGAITLTGGTATLNAAPTISGLTIGDFTATGGAAVNVGGFIGASNNAGAPWTQNGNFNNIAFPLLMTQLGVGLDRTESVGKFAISTTGTQAVTFTSVISSDAVGAITMNASDGAETFGAQINAGSYQGITGTYGPISVTSSTRGAVAFNGVLAGTGGDIALTTGSVGTNSGSITIGTIFQNGAAGNLTATTAGIVGGAAGNITYTADVEGGSIGTTNLTSTAFGNVVYGGGINGGGASTFAGTVGAVNISTKDLGTVAVSGLYGQNIASAQTAASAGAVVITAEKGAVTITSAYGDKVTAVGALSATTTTGAITYSTQTTGSVAAGAVPGAGAGTLGSIAAGTETGSIGQVTLSTSGLDGDITVNADLEATSFAGITATTTSPNGTAPVNAADIKFQNANFWAASVGQVTATTAEGSILVDVASSFRGFTKGTGTNMSVGAITLTATAKGAVQFDALVEATSVNTAAANNGTMSIGDLTLTGNSTGNIAFGGIVRTGIYDAAANIALLDGVVDQGTIGKITFNGNTTLTSAAVQFGTQATQTTLQPIQNGAAAPQNAQFALGTSQMGAFTVNGTLTSVAGTGVDGLLRAQKLDSFTVTGNAALDATGSAANGLIFVPTMGQVTLGGTLTSLTATATNPVFVGWNLAGFTFNATKTSLIGGTVILALDATSALDTIGNITSTGRLEGNAVASNFNAVARGEIEASSIGNVTLAATLDGSGPINAVATDLDIRASNSRGNAALDVDGALAGNQAGDYAITSETVATDGSNLASYVIGNVSVTCIQDGTIDNNSVFSGANSFVALGGIGNITLTGQPGGAVQPDLFALGTDAAWFTVGDGDSIGTQVATGSRVDFNGNGKFAYLTEVAELTSDFTGGTVNVGKVDINVDNTGPVNAINEDVNKVGGATGGAIDGFAVLVGTQLDTAGVAGVGLGNNDGLAFNLHTADRIDTNLSGHVVSVRIQNATVSNQANVIAQALGVVATGSTAGFGGVIAVAGSVVAAVHIDDIVNDVVPLGPVTMSDGQLAVIGNDVGGDGDQDRWDVNELLVYVI